MKNIVCLMVTVEQKEEDTGEGVHPTMPTSAMVAFAIEDRLGDQTKHDGQLGWRTLEVKGV
jgi:hypothetical protein